MKKLRIGLVGFGFMGKTHLWSVKNLPFFYKTDALGFEAEVVSVCASTLNRARAVAEEYGIPKAVATADEIIADPTIDVVDICSPNPYHFDVAKAAILAGKHVLCEKPLTVTAAEAGELARLAKEHGVICGTVFNNRFLAPIMRARQLIGGSQPLVNPKDTKPLVIAIEEINRGLITYTRDEQPAEEEQTQEAQ